MTTYWICTEHLRDPSVICGARGEGDSGAARHTERAPKHSTLTTTRRELADRFAQRPDDSAALCSWCAAEKHEKCRGADACGCPCNERSAA